VSAHHISDEDLVLYSMQSLSAGETSAAALHLEQCAECARQLAQVSGDLALLSLSVDQLPLPAGARSRFMNRIAAEPQTTAVPQAAAPLAAPAVSTPPRIESEPARVIHEIKHEIKPRHNWFPILVPWAAAFALLALAGYLGNRNQRLNQLLNGDKGQIAQLSADAAHAQEVLDTLTSPAAKQVTLTEGKGAQAPTGRTSYLAEKGALVFVGNNLKPIPEGKTYELWVIPANGKAPIPAGLFRPDDHGSASVVLPKLPEGVPAKAFGVTIENAEGATKPTMPIVLSGAAGL
jgi:anti-sigma factor RsiW